MTADPQHRAKSYAELVRFQELLAEARDKAGLSPTGLATLCRSYVLAEKMRRAIRGKRVRKVKSTKPLVISPTLDRATAQPADVPAAEIVESELSSLSSATGQR
jgi:hypothetical protein